MDSGNYPADPLYRIVTLTNATTGNNFPVYTTETFVIFPSSHYATTASSELISREDLRRLRSFTPREKARVSPKHFRPERTPSRSSAMGKLRSLQLDVRSVPQASRTAPSSRTMRRTPGSSWPSAVRRFSGRRS